MSKLLFEEKQSFRKTTWMYILLTSIAAISFLPLLFLPFEESKIGVYILLITYGLIGYIFVGSTLYLRVFSDRIELSFPPFFWAKRTFEIQNIKSWKVRPYSAMNEFGGWGWRKGFGGTGYIVSGDQLLEIEDTIGKKTMVTTLKPKQLEEAMKILTSERHLS